MLLESLPTFFLATNSADGFVNGFKNAFDPKDGWKAYLIKGGPGTGKSSFMKSVATSFVNRGEKVSVVPCSSDPDSLDAVILESRKVVVFDATAPHVMDPVYPGVCEEILNFGEFWNADELKDNKEEIIALTDKNKALHRRASRFISAIGQLKRNEMKISLLATDIDKTFKFASRFASRYIKSTEGEGEEKIIYLSALTPKGEVFYQETIDKLCKEKVVILDEYGTVSNMIFSFIRDYALKSGMKIITVKNNILPFEQIDHILIPSLSLAFCAGSLGTEIKGENVRKIHASRFMNRELLKEYTSRIHFGRKLIKELTDGAVATLKEAKEVHDELEAYYIKAMDFTLLNEFCRKFAEKLILH